MRVMLGHDGPPTNYWDKNLISGTQLAECPLRTLLRAEESTPELAREIERHRLEYFPAYEAGHLLVAGGIGDQPARYLDFMNLFAAMRPRQQERFDALNAPSEDA